MHDNMHCLILEHLLCRLHIHVSFVLQSKCWHKYTCCGMQVLGWEGLWGSLVMGVIGMPLAWFLPGPDIGRLILLR